MKTAFDTDSILYKLLKRSAVKTAISGGIYVGGGRPLDSNTEDIEINTISVTQVYCPQIGTSNINIYVPDRNVTIGGKEQLQADRKRLCELANMVIKVVRSANVDGLKVIPTSMTILQEPKVRQHFVNIRVDWNIQN